MRCNRLVLLLTLVAAVGCESGWDIRGRVSTTGVSDKARPLFVYILDQPTIDPVKRPAEPLLYEELSRADMVPAEGLTFQKRNFGCHRGAVMMVAWAPMAGAPVPAAMHKPFEPKAGDLVAFSDVRVPYCGPRTKWEEIDFSLGDANASP